MAIVLVVEDDDAWRHALVIELKRRGHTVLDYSHASPVLDLLDSDAHIDLMLCDVVLPTGTQNGISLSLMTRRRRPDLPVKLMSAVPDLPHNLTAEFGGVLSKNVPIPELIAAAGLT